MAINPVPGVQTSPSGVLQSSFNYISQYDYAIQYEPDLVLHMVSAGNASGKAPIAEVFKSRYAIFKPGETYEFTAELLKDLASYLSEGIDPEVLVEKQRLDYVKSIKEYCGTNKGKKSIWKSLKDQAGFADTDINDIPYEAIRELHKQLILD